MNYIFYTILFLIGICFGSFLCCQARRLHLNSSTKTKLRTSRSVCLHCHYQLKWYDNIPLISWLALGGKCRKCHKPIGIAEFLSELGVGLAFLVLGTTIEPIVASPLTWCAFGMLLVFVLSISFLAIYDGLYGELPTKFLFLSIFLAIIVLILRDSLILTLNPFSIDLIWRPLASVAILGGLYLILYLVSKGRWVGDGDWLLATAIAIALADPWPALIALFLANLIACFVMLPFLYRSKRHKIYFGPFLVIAFVIAFVI